MTKKEIQDTSNERRVTSDEVPFSSNSPPPRLVLEDAGAGIRLSIGQWIIVGIVCLAFLYLTPIFWEHVEKFSPGPDFRIPYNLSNDYWLYERYCRYYSAKRRLAAKHELTSSQNEIPVIGDSVIWGHFVPGNQTLSHYLDETTDEARFANFGLDGIHPAAMEGLLRYYGENITNKKMILHFNPLWMSTPKLDLQSDKEFIFNHPELVAQFIPDIPCYKASFSARISAVLRRYITFPNWVSHLNMTYFQNMDMPAWTIEHPYKNPLKAVTFNLPNADSFEKSETTSPSKNNPIGTGYQWVAPETSFQWKCFKSTIQLLQKRGNRVFVLVGPFNEHLLEGANLESYRNLKKDIELWLTTNNIDYYAPEVLRAELYVDASHPTSEGYALLAQQLLENKSFKDFILNTGRD